jgi:hypothetical protein
MCRTVAKEHPCCKKNTHPPTRAYIHILNVSPHAVADRNRVMAASRASREDRLRSATYPLRAVADRNRQKLKRLASRARNDRRQGQARERYLGLPPTRTCIRFGERSNSSSATAAGIEDMPSAARPSANARALITS